MSSWRPQREVEIVAGTPPGGGLDRSARALVKAIESRRLLDVPAKVSNVAGEGGRKAWAYLDQHAGDPHVLCISSSNLATDHLLGASAFDHERAFTPLAILYTEYIAFLARSDSSLKSGADLIARFATGAGSVTVALSTSLGNPNHIALAKVVRHAGGDVKAPKIRVFDSALDAVADVVAGNADVCAVTAASAVKETRRWIDASARGVCATAPVRTLCADADLARAVGGLRDRRLARREWCARADAGADRILGRHAGSGRQDRSVDGRAGPALLDADVSRRRIACAHSANASAGK